MSAHMANMEAKHCSFREAHSAQQFCDVFLAQQAWDDGISALARVVSDLRSQVNRLSNLTPTLSASGTGNHDGSSAKEECPRQKESLANVKSCAPDAHKDLNGGKGHQFKRHCWLCGCNCTHSTKGHRELSLELKEKCKEATTEATQSSSTNVGNIRLIATLTASDGVACQHGP